jgi:cyclopropane fatty-acyl-phospholipid synthase-like methyltransferase
MYRQNVFTRHTLAAVDFLEQELRLLPGSVILDMGCGTGRHSVVLEKRGYRVTGVQVNFSILTIRRQD